jgi:hypothetical protein
VTSVFITFDRTTDTVMAEALRARGVTLAAAHGATDVELYHGDVDDTPDAVDAWFDDLPWTPDDTATLVAYGRDVVITTVIVDGEPASTTRADRDGVEVDDYLEDAA